MHHILIIDDEVHAARGLQAGIGWSRLGIAAEHVHLAYSVQQGQELFKQFPISILICDIEMPQQNGMEMQEWVREHYPDTLTIFLTCHSDFVFLQRALQLSSFDYLLKPVDYEEIEQVIGKAQRQLAESKAKMSYEAMYDHYRKLWESQRPIVAERFWQGLLNRSFPSKPSVIAEQLSRHGLEHHPEVRYLPILLKIRRWYKILTQRDEQIMKYAISNAVQDGLQRAGKEALTVSLDNEQGLILFIVAAEGDHAVWSDLDDGGDMLIKFCNEHLYCDISLYVGTEVAISEVVNVVDKLIELNKNNIVQINTIIMLEEWREQPTKMPDVQWSQWLCWMKEQQEQLLFEHVSLYFNSWKQEQICIDAKGVEAFYQEFLQMIYTYLYQMGLHVNQVFDQKSLAGQSKEVLHSVHALEEWVVYIIQVAMNRVHTIKKSMTVVEKAVQYIKDHIGEQQLSREDIARHVYLNPDYLTRVFKKETGMSISDYMQQCRLDYAKRLLKETNQTISEIAVASGYSNISYFSTIFKKFTSLNPVDYRKQQRQNQAM